MVILNLPSFDEFQKPKLRISASLVAAPWLDLKNTIKGLENHGVEMLHFDIEDGHFNPNLLLGLKIISELRPSSNLIFDVHLMVENPEKYLDDLITIGVDRIAFHWEACSYPQQLIKKIKDGNIKSGIALNPITRMPDLSYLLPELDFVTFLSTGPMESNGSYIPSTIEKLNSAYLAYPDHEVEWVIDGGVSDKNISSILSGHADIVVIGKYLFSGLLRERIDRLNQAMVDNKF